ncbi:class I SAM-dependent methyltransferase [Oceanospirillum sp.]|uniref:class I SAM-dependent methyltransferase n=1 Tax=Oceanospirillum sp. TaxID=2021254 RepID=UPI003A8E665B
MSLLLNQALAQMLPSARVKEVTLPGINKIRLWLVDPEPIDRAFSSDEIIAILEHTPYWGFCWGSGLALARFILENPEEVTGKRVIDFGAGSGVVAVAAAMVGAEVIACDIDPISQLACKENACLNKVSFQVAEDLLALPEMEADLLIAADVLYDRENLPWLDIFFRFAPEVWVADSRVRNFSHSSYQLADTFNANTVPEMGEPYEFSSIRFYRSV